MLIYHILALIVRLAIILWALIKRQAESILGAASKLITKFHRSQTNSN